MTQTIIVALILLSALAYLGHRAWKRLRPKKVGCNNCGCD
jgi:hypothetical protein